MKAVVAANQEKALVGAFSVLTNLRMELFQALLSRSYSILLTILAADRDDPRVLHLQLPVQHPARPTHHLVLLHRQDRLHGPYNLITPVNCTLHFVDCV